MQIRYINPNGDKLELDDWPKSRGYLLQNWEGFGEIPTYIQTQKAPFQDGETLIDQLLEPRNMTVDLVMFGETKQGIYDKRRKLQKLFNPKLGTGVLQWEQEDGTTYEIEVVPDGSPQFPGGNAKSNFHQTALIYFKAPNPFWKTDYTSGGILSFFVPEFGFPLELSNEYELETDGTNRTILTNDGDVETPVFIEFFGPASNPKIINETTGEYIEVTQELLEGEKLLINTAFGKKSVIFDNGNEQVNAFGQIDLHSTFWQMQVGDNSIVYTADHGIDTASMNISFKERFIGV
jgi:hypothetical protein